MHAGRRAIFDRVLYLSQADGICWWCGTAPADSREHKIKKADLVRQFGKGPYTKMSRHRNGHDDFLQGPDSKIVKFKATMCADCNNRRSQPIDLAYDAFTDYVKEHERHVLSSRAIDLRAVYGRDDWEEGRDGMLRYLAKHAGCRLAEHAIEVPESIVAFLHGGPQPCEQMSIDMTIRGDIAKAHRDALADGSLWLGSLEITEQDADQNGLVIESHYGFGWLRFSWGIGVGSEDYPWPFHGPVQRIPRRTAEQDRAEYGDPGLRTAA